MQHTVDNFSIIAITPEVPVHDEAAIICSMLDSGVVNRVHIRHPQSDADEVKAIIQAIPADKQLRISVHEPHHTLTIGTRMGIHFSSHSQTDADKALKKSRLIDKIDRDDVGITRSCHSLDEILKADGYDYFFLSPFFDSISKQGYHAAIDLDEPMLAVASALKTIIPLGGIDDSKLSVLYENDFCAAAMLGYLWPMVDGQANVVDRDEQNRRLEKIRKICNDMDFNS